MAWKDLEKKRKWDEEYYAKNKEVIRAKARARHHANKPPPKPAKPKKTYEEIRARQKEYYQKNREKILVDMKARYAANPEYHKEYRENNQERIKEHRDKYYVENKEKIYQWSREQQRKAFEKNPDKVRAMRRLSKKKQKAKDPQRYNAMMRKSNEKTQKAIVSELRDCYIRQLLCKHPVIKRLLPKDIPQELVEAKRLEIQIRRLINEKCN
jgi:hypothetical protein